MTVTPTPRTRLINPRLGTFFGIFVSLLAGLVLVLAVLEQLGTADATLRLAMLFGPILLFGAIGIAAATHDPLEYFAAGRRVPAFYCGSGLAISTFGATGLIGITGLLFVSGFDALCLVIGGISGFVLMAVLLAPFIRKFGAYTLPSYLGRRFDSPALRVAAAIVLAVPVLLMLAAELRMGTLAASMLWEPSAAATMLMLAAVLVATLAAGGVRAMTWSGVAQALTALAGIVVPLVIVGVLLTNLPVPQLSHGPAVKLITRLEQQLGLPTVYASAWTFDLPPEGLQALAKKFVVPFGSIGSLGFLGVTLTIMAGVAAAPWLLPRVATSPGVYEARKSLGWATVVFGIVMMSLATTAVFLRLLVMELAAAQTTAVPAWLKHLEALRFADFDKTAATLGAGSILFNRDAVLFALPVAHGLPAVVVYLAIAGAVAAALAAASATTVTFGSLIAEDVAGSIVPDNTAGAQRVWLARGTIAGAAIFGAIVAALVPADPVKLMLWAFALTASAAFPVLALSIWWKRLNAAGALAGLLAGFAVAAAAIVVGELRIVTFDSPLAAVIGLPAGLAAAIAVSLVTPAPSRHVLELMRDIRIPGGEILYDREMRIARIKQRKGGG
jgi:cation/acetate symporter